MKIVNICLCGPYNIGWGYQDNLLAKYQAKNNHSVSVIASNFINDKKSDGVIRTKEGIYHDDSVKIIRLKNSVPFISYLRIYNNLYNTLCEEKPDFIFVHGCQFMSIVSVCKYLKKHPNVKCRVDNHADHTNSAISIFGEIIHKTLWKYTANRINKYSQVFYGVLPARCDFLYEMYDVPKEKIELLVMGADDELVEESKKRLDLTRAKYNISSNDFLIVSGGKIDIHKKEIINLLKSYQKMDNNKIKMIIFGSLSNELEKEFINNLGNAQYIKWLNQKEIYDLLCASNLAIYPGRHSVLWEQTVGCGIPAIFKDLPNTHHIDVGGNCIISNDMSIEYLINTILDLNNNNDKYNKMKKVSIDKGTKIFSYREIAKNSIVGIEEH